jgi:IPT/TIG domain
MSQRMKVQKHATLYGAPEGSSWGPEPEPPEPGPAPTLDSLKPAEAALGDPDLAVSCQGSGFTAESVIVFNGGDEPTTFVDDTEVTTVVKPSTATVAGSFPVSVRNADRQQTEPLNFTFTEPVVKEAEATTTKRTKR